jgi:DNA-binding CsgD family transcriptional regulator
VSGLAGDCADAPRRLTEREREVLRRIARGESTKEIARGLTIAQSTVRTHAQNVLTKLDVRSRVEAAAAVGPELGAGPPRDPASLGALTAREAEVLCCIAAGLTRAAVAERLFLSPHTVRTHIRNVLAKLEVHSTLAAVALARRAL